MASIFGTSSSSGGTSTTQLDPDIKNAFLTNYAYGRATADSLPMQQFAPRTGDYYSGSNVTRQTALNGQGLYNMGDAADITGANAMTSAVDNVGMYQNPYLRMVAGNTLNDLGRANAMALNQVRGDAVSRGAFGGSRQALAEAETNRNFFDRAGSTLGNLYSQGYTQALGASQADLNRSLTAAGQLANIGGQQQAAGFQSGQALTNLGLADQQYQQQMIDAPRNLMLERQALRNQSLGVNPAGGSGSTSTSSNSGRSGLFK